MTGVFPTFRHALVMVVVMAAAGATCTIVQQAPAGVRTPTAAIIGPDGGEGTLQPPLTAFCGTATLRAEVQEALKDARKMLERARNETDVTLLIRAQAQVDRAMWLIGNCQ